MQNTVIGVYDEYSKAQSAFNELSTRGFDRANIQMSPEQDTQEGRTSTLSRSDEDEGWGIGKFFRNMFGSDDDTSASHSDVYHEAVRRGSYLVSVQAASDKERDQACEILNRFDPVDIDERSTQWRTQGWSGYDKSAAAYTNDEAVRERGLYSTAAKPTTGTTQGEARLPVIEEELKVGKRMVQRGGVRIYQHVTERPVEETVRLRDEKVKVSRKRVNKAATQADLAAFKEGTVELRETAEEPVISKGARVVEEVVVNRDVREHDETVRDKLRRTDVEVEQLAGGGSAGRAGFDRDYYRNHWQTSFANQGGRYEDYEPAYRFGSDMNTNATYGSRSWNEIEPEARRDWEGRNPGSSWERAKDAVRHAYERVAR